LLEQKLTQVFADLKLDKIGLKLIRSFYQNSRVQANNVPLLP